ncbi:MAG: tautomerase family protein [Anaerobutyricum sp.]
MPYIEVKLAKQASRKQERILTEKLGEAITTVPGKTAAGLMVSISSDEHIYKGGEFLEYGAYVHVVFKTGVTRTDCEKFNEAIFTNYGRRLESTRRMYILHFSTVMISECRDVFVNWNEINSK